MTQWQTRTLYGFFSQQLRGRVSTQRTTEVTTCKLLCGGQAGWAIAGRLVGVLATGMQGAHAPCCPTQPQRRELPLAGHHAPKPTCFARHVPTVGLVLAWMPPITADEQHSEPQPPRANDPASLDAFCLQPSRALSGS